MSRMLSFIYDLGQQHTSVSSIADKIDK